MPNFWNQGGSTHNHPAVINNTLFTKRGGCEINTYYSYKILIHQHIYLSPSELLFLLPVVVSVKDRRKLETQNRIVIPDNIMPTKHRTYRYNYTVR